MVQTHTYKLTLFNTIVFSGYTRNEDTELEPKIRCSLNQMNINLCVVITKHALIKMPMVLALPGNRQAC